MKKYIVNLDGTNFKVAYNSIDDAINIATLQGKRTYLVATVTPI
jgi:hypothetical protein